MKKKRTGLILLIAIAIVVLLAGVVLFVMFKSASSMGIGSAPVADYENRVPIWNTVAGNSARSKLDLLPTLCVPVLIREP